MPDTFEITPALRAWALTDVPGLDIDRETAKLRDWEFKDAHSDWNKTWRTWMRRAFEREALGRTSQTAPPKKERLIL